MEFKLFSKPDYANGRPGDAAWYRDRAVSDHINETGHRERLLEALNLIGDAIEQVKLSSYPYTLSDFGAGNGGLLAQVKKKFWGINAWGYDLSPKAVEWGKEKYTVDLRCDDVLSNPIDIGSIVVLTEFLEHIVDPHGMLKRLHLSFDPQWIVASSPGFESPGKQYEYHLWSWYQGDSFAKMFEREGWRVRRHFFRADCGTQFLLASRT
jgi:hypothetical protein